jgi:hypothetical protein
MAALTGQSGDSGLSGLCGGISMPSGYSSWWQTGIGYFDTGGSSTTANNAVISKWSGGVNATQGTVGFQPLLKTNILNGKSALLFDGVDDFLVTAGLTDTSCTIIIAVSGFSTATFPPRFFGQGGDRSVFLNGTGGGGNGQYAFYNDGTVPGINPLGRASNLNSIITLKMQSGGNAHVSRMNGANSSSVNATGAVASSLAFGAEATTGVNPGNCYIYEAVYYPRILTLAECIAAETVINAKFGIF